MYISLGLLFLLFCLWLGWKVLAFSVSAGAEISAAQQESLRIKREAARGEYWVIKEIDGKLMQNVLHGWKDEFVWVPYNKEGSDLAERYKKAGIKDSVDLQLAMSHDDWAWNNTISQWYKVEPLFAKEISPDKNTEIN